jgi:hypothetical protein
MFSQSSVIMCWVAIVGSIQSNPLVFQRSGTIATDVTAIILTGEMDITPLISQLRNVSNIDGYLQDIWKSISPKSRQMDGRYLASQIRLVREQVTTAKALIEDITASAAIDGWQWLMIPNGNPVQYF